MKALALSLIRHSPLPTEFQEKLLFFGKMGYWPNFQKPRSYNEKVNWRKLRSTNKLYVKCADKLAVREYVRERIGEEYLVPVLFSGPSITPDELLALGDNIVVKTNHDSGSVHLIRENSRETAEAVCEKIAQSLKVNYGRRTREWWYARIRPKVFVEKLLSDEDGTPAWDFKFFIFQRPDPEGPKILIEVDFERNTPHHHRSFYDEHGNLVDWIDADIVIDDVPNHRTPFPKLSRYEEMREAALKLAEGFDHVRVDMYHVREKVYFGEMTFSEGGGRSRWTPRTFDYLLGSFWDLNPKNERPVEPIPAVRQQVTRQDPVKRVYQSGKKGLKNLLESLAVGTDRFLRFLSLPYLVATSVNREECRRNSILVYLDFLYIFFRLGGYPDHYTACRLWEKPKSEWKFFYGRGYDPRAIARRNRRARRAECDVLFEDKEVCYQLCQSFGFPLPAQHAVLDPNDDLEPALTDIFDQSTTETLYLKPVGGDGGRGVCVASKRGEHITLRESSAPSRAVSPREFALSFRSVVQERVTQHPDLDALFPGALNTVRIASLFTPEKDVHIVGAFLRIGRGDNFVDNGDQGGIGAAINLDSGQLARHASDNRGQEFEQHPDTSFAFGSLTLPHWPALIELAREVLRRFAPYNKFLGMDIGLSPFGPVLIEVNDIFDCGRFESVVGPIFKDPDVLRCAKEFGLITHRRFD
ncbi:MAG: ATP-grasp fold amidoligase family protein [Verrucomicrobiota bacterium]